MLSRRSSLMGLATAALTPAEAVASPNRLALLVAAPWPGEAFVAGDVLLMRRSLESRGVRASEIVSSVDPVDRPRLLTTLGDVARRVSSWRSGELLIYYDGHGMYREAGSGARVEPGLQLTPDRNDPRSALLWRELFAALPVPRGVRIALVPDCCHTNLLVGLVPRHVGALVMKSDPQTALTCRTGTSLFGPPQATQRHGVISYYAATTLARARAVGSWLAALDAASEADVAAGRLPGAKRLRLMVEGDASVPIVGSAV